MVCDVSCSNHKWVLYSNEDGCQNKGQQETQEETGKPIVEETLVQQSETEAPKPTSEEGQTNGPEGSPHQITKAEDQEPQDTSGNNEDGQPSGKADDHPNEDKGHKSSNGKEEVQPLPLHDHSHLQQAGNGLSGCPVCLANAANTEGTFITTVKEQSEGLETVSPSPNPDQDLHKLKVHVADKETSLPDENTEFGAQDSNPTAFARPKTSRPMGGVRMRVGDPRMPSGRPQSAADHSRYYTITHPPSVVATGTSARLNTALDGNGAFKTDFQQQREEVWKRTTRHRKPRPLTAIVQRSSSQFPPPQRPSSPIASTNIRNPGLKITRTDQWLGGGRDLYWEAVRQRPKSGHTPGWKEGLPESMKKQRPKSAFAPSIKRKGSRPSSSTALYVRSCVSCRSFDVSHPGYALTGDTEDLDVTYIMPQSHQLLQQHPPPLSSPVSEDGQDPLPLLGPDMEARDGIFIQGRPLTREAVCLQNMNNIYKTSYSDSGGYLLKLQSTSGEHLKLAQTDNPGFQNIENFDEVHGNACTSPPLFPMLRPFSALQRKRQRRVTCSQRPATATVITLSEIPPFSASLEDLKPVLQGKSMTLKAVDRGGSLAESYSCESYDDDNSDEANNYDNCSFDDYPDNDVNNDSNGGDDNTDVEIVENDDKGGNSDTENEPSFGKVTLNLGHDNKEENFESPKGSTLSENKESGFPVTTYDESHINKMSDAEREHERSVKNPSSNLLQKVSKKPRHKRQPKKALGRKPRVSREEEGKKELHVYIDSGCNAGMTSWENSSHGDESGGSTWTLTPDDDDI